MKLAWSFLVLSLAGGVVRAEARDADFSTLELVAPMTTDGLCRIERVVHSADLRYMHLAFTEQGRVARMEEWRIGDQPHLESTDTYVWTGARLTSIVNEAGAVLAFEYDDKGFLTRMTMPGQTVDFEWTVTRVKKPISAVRGRSSGFDLPDQLPYEGTVVKTIRRGRNTRPGATDYDERATYTYDARGTLLRKGCTLDTQGRTKSCERPNTKNTYRWKKDLLVESAFEHTDEGLASSGKDVFEYDRRKRVIREVEHRVRDGRSEVQAEHRFEYRCRDTIDDAPIWPR